ncbi:MAG: purine-nucleoside phosphorylase [Bacilli bacterium]|nr:purine-nucleoside phosphorylase [Bacilli bacterium]
MTPHNEAKKCEIAKKVLMPGDPMRAKYIAENFLKDVKLVNEVRGMYAFTGTYEGTEITVMGSGMGIPSMGIYAYELFKFYDVEEIIRIGSAGANDPSLKLLDVVLTNQVYSSSNFAKDINNDDCHFIEPSLELNEKIINVAKEKGIVLNVGMTNCSEVFDAYITNLDEYLSKLPEGVLATEMEAFALCYLAKMLGKKATCLMTVVDSKFTDEIVSSQQREKSLNNMIKLALDAIK